LQQGLRARRVLVRHFDATRIDQFLRISVGTEEDSAALMVALRELIG